MLDECKNCYYDSNHKWHDIGAKMSKLIFLSEFAHFPA
jgi:hypothetical protein